MGNEIIVLFLIVPLIVFGLNVWALLKTKNRAEYCILFFLNIIFLGYFFVSGIMTDDVMQSILFGCVLFVPFQMISMLGATLLPYGVKGLWGIWKS